MTALSAPDCEPTSKNLQNIDVTSKSISSELELCTAKYCSIDKRLARLQSQGFRNGERGRKSCSQQQKRLACEISPWKNKDLKERLERVIDLTVSIQQKHSFQFDLRTYACLKSLESPLFEPASTNYNACRRVKGIYSTANGLSQVTRSTARRLFKKWKFQSKLPGYQNIKTGDDLFEAYSKDPALQLELGLFYLETLTQLPSLEIKEKIKKLERKAEKKASKTRKKIQKLRSSVKSNPSKKNKERLFAQIDRLETLLQKNTQNFKSSRETLEQKLKRAKPRSEKTVLREYKGYPLYAGSDSSRDRSLKKTLRRDAENYARNIIKCKTCLRRHSSGITGYGAGKNYSSQYLECMNSIRPKDKSLSANFKFYKDKLCPKKKRK